MCNVFEIQVLLNLIHISTRVNYWLGHRNSPFFVLQRAENIMARVWNVMEGEAKGVIKVHH